MQMVYYEKLTLEHARRVVHRITHIIEPHIAFLPTIEPPHFERAATFSAALHHAYLAKHREHGELETHHERMHPTLSLLPGQEHGERCLAYSRVRCEHRQFSIAMTSCNRVEIEKPGGPAPIASLDFRFYRIEVFGNVLHVARVKHTSIRH